MHRVPLSFLHGFMGHPSDWDPIRQGLPEFESHALEVTPTEGWMSSVVRLAEIIPQGSVLIGYSMGARLALGVAMERPEVCSALVFISGNPGLETVEARDQRWKWDENTAYRLETEPLADFLEAWYRLPVFESVPVVVRTAERDRKLARSARDWPAILLANSISKQPDYWKRLRELSVPTLVVAGQQDEKYRMIAERFVERTSLPFVAKQIVPNCGHLVHREQPPTLIGMIRDFLHDALKHE
ncbi:MAG: alpha/beta fold hydrolase [Planctomycetota bacterium]